MSLELLTVLENIEREKGISQRVLIESVEAALVSAAKKVLHDNLVHVLTDIKFVFRRKTRIGFLKFDCLNFNSYIPKILHLLVKEA